MTIERYKLRAWWGERRETIPGCAESFRAFVNALPGIDPIFLNWLSGKPRIRPLFPVPISLDDATRFVERNQARYDSPRRVWPERGYRLSGWNAGPPGTAPPDAPQNADFVGSTRVRTGGYASQNPHHNSVEIVLSKKRLKTRQPWLASELRPLMKLVLSVWRPRELSVDCNRYFDFKPSVADPRYAPTKRVLPPGAVLLTTGDRLLLPWVGWLTYLPADLAAKVTLPSDIEVERLGDGGIIATLCEEPFTIDNPVHMARARAMEAAIRTVQT